MATLSCMLLGASEIYVVDRVPERLQKVKEMGATPIDFTQGDPVEQIMTLRKENKNLTGRLRPGEEKMAGVDHGIDAVGYQARKDSDPDKGENPTQVIEDLVRLVNPTGKIGVVGVYLPRDPKGVSEKAKQGRFELPWGQIFEKGLSIGTGQAPVKRYNEFLRDLIITGRAKPSAIVSHRLPLDSAAQAYKEFDQRGDGFTKIILKPGKDAGTLVETVSSPS